MPDSPRSHPAKARERHPQVLATVTGSRPLASSVTRAAPADLESIESGPASTGGVAAGRAGDRLDLPPNVALRAKLRAGRAAMLGDVLGSATATLPDPTGGVVPVDATVATIREGRISSDATTSTVNEIKNFSHDE